MPVSWTSNRKRHVRPPAGRLADPSRATPPWRGELEPVADQVDQHLAQPGRVALDHQRGACRASSSRSSSPRSAACGAISERTCSSTSRRREVDPLQLELAGLDPREVEDVVDDARAGAGRRCGSCRRSAAAAAVSCSAASRSAMPSTPVIGVRISWLIAARNSDLAWLARSPPRPACAIPRPAARAGREHRPGPRDRASPR